MAAMRGPRLQVGSAAWVAEERSSALRIAESEVEEFSYSARNELDWLNEHMAGIFNENETNIAETFKTPGRLRAKTPRTIRQGKTPESRVPLSDVFGGTPNGAIGRSTQKISKIQTPPRLQPAQSKASNAVKSPRLQIFSPKPLVSEQAAQDSGYHGSQDIDAMDVDYIEDDDQTQPFEDDLDDFRDLPAATEGSPTKDAPRDSVHKSPKVLQDHALHASSERDYGNEEPLHEEDAVQPDGAHATASSNQTSDQPDMATSSPSHEQDVGLTQVISTRKSDMHMDDANSPSDASSPIRPVVRKSSLNFASLPAREPLTAGKSIGARVSRTSHLDHKRTSYYSRPTGGKSIGNYARRDDSDNEDQVDADAQDPEPASEQGTRDTENLAMNHNKTYTQRLQDQINMLGKSQPNGGRPSKSIPNLASVPTVQSTQVQAPDPAQEPQEPKSPAAKLEHFTTPGAFPEDDDDDWIDPPTTKPIVEAASSRPKLSKSHSTDVMEGIHHQETVGGSEFAQNEGGRVRRSTISPESPTVPERLSIIHGHGKSASVADILKTNPVEDQGGLPLKRAATVSNPSMVAASNAAPSGTSSQSPARSFRDSPLKQVKNKLSSILKSSKGILASSAALSAESKTSILASPSTAKLSSLGGPSTETLTSKSNAGIEKPQHEPFELEQDNSPSRPVSRRTRASVERVKEEKRREKETKRIADQEDKLEKAREKEREKARVFSKEQEKIAALEKQVASKKDSEKPMVKETPKPRRVSPRKTKEQQETDARSVEQDTEMSDAISAAPPSTVPRSAGPGHSVRKELKRPVKPGKDSQIRVKQAPTVIRVNTGSQHSQYHPASSTMSATAQEGTTTQPQSMSKASKASLQSLKSSVSSTGRPKALELAARKKEQDEREVQRRRDAKAEMERKRAAAQEEQRKQEQQRRQEAERQRQREREQAASQAEAKKNAQRQAAIERAKQTRAPPPPVRSQPNGPPEYNLTQEKTGLNGFGMKTESAPRPPSRLNSGIFRSQEDINRPKGVASKSLAKRPLGQDANDDGQSRRPPSRGGPSYQAKDAKRRRTSDEFRDELDMDNPPNIKGPPVRPSAGFKKDLQSKSLFQNGYTTAPPSVTRDLFKATVTTQHTGQVKTAHPLDMAQISKGAIPFAPNPNPAGPAYKTPARPGAVNNIKSAVKSAQRSSPRFQNGESIELPEIQTDDEDDDEDEPHGGVIATWADSPDLRRALVRQETMDPSQIFGPPAPLNMEEVFNKSKDKWHKFRARTSSANWSGTDRLTEDDIRKDLAARDKMRREGGWSYEMSKDMV